MKKIDLNNKKILALIIALVVLAILLQAYFKIINKYRNDRIFALESENYAKEIKNPVFKVDKIMIFSSANVDDFSENKDLSRINVTQFTDFAIHIDNTIKDSKLTEENTINNIYIDDIGITATKEIGVKKFSCKSIDDFGKYVPITESVKKISYDVIHKNSDKENVDKTKSFFTDCSEYLMLSYVNENIVEAVDASDSEEKISLDGSILKYLNINLEQLNYKINFTINIENNLGQNFYYNCSLNVNLDEENGKSIYE